MVLPLLAILLGSLGAFAQQTSQTADYHSLAVSEEFYKSIRFSWTDSEGVTHTSDLTEPASDPRHIVALLTEVYTNPAVPGFLYDHAVNFKEENPEIWDEERENCVVVPYEPCTYHPYSMDPTRRIQAPVEGATALIVEMKDDYDGSANGPQDSFEIWASRALDAVKSVQLITHQMYVDEIEDSSTNPGFLFNVEATLNKFFIITKGCNRPLKGTYPIEHNGFPLFYNMFEEFSPTNGGPMYDAFASMDSGEQFAVDHNCSTVIGQNHLVVMDAQGSNRKRAVNLMFYLPDYRFRGETRSKNEGDARYEPYSFYAHDYQPYFFFNKIRARIDGEVITVSPEAGETHTAWVPVTWVSSYKDITRSMVPEQFYIYRVVNDTFDANPISADEILTNKQYNNIFGEDGSIIRSEDNTVRIFVKEPQDAETRSVRYVVLGRRFGSDFSYVESNEVEAQIPGFEASEALNIIIDGTPISHYDVETEVNSYSNSISLTDGVTATGNRLLAEHIVVRDGDTPGTIFELRRFAQGSAGYDVVAEMEIVGADLVYGNGWAVNKYIGEIRYADGVTPNATAAFKAKVDPVTHEFIPTEPITALDGKNGVVATFTDNFQASTKFGDHPQGYTYQMAFCAATAQDEEAPTKSNTVSTTIPVRALYVGYVPYSLQEILADVEANNLLPVNPIGVAFQTKKNTSISGYTVTNVTKGMVVAHAIRTPSGIFERVVFDNNGEANSRLNPVTSPGFFGKLPFRLTADVDIDDQFALTLEYSNGNTYGNVRCSLTPVPAPEVIDQPLKYVNFQNGHYNYESELTWTSSDLTVAPWPAFADEQQEYAVFDYNVWSRPSGQETFDHVYMIEGVQPMNLLDDEDTSIKSVPYDFTSHYATVNNPVQLDHIVRLYAKAPAELLIDFDNEAEGFVISETDSQAVISQAGPIVSAIESIEVDTDSADATYFDLMGRPVDRSSLLPGIYLRVTADRSEKVTIR